MNWLPSVPTDNLYKFFAVLGLRLSFGLMLFFAWLSYLQFQIEKEGRQYQSYYFSVRVESQISDRLASIEANRPNENRLDWTPPGASLEQEKKFLHIAQENHRQFIQKNKDVPDREPRDEFQIMNLPIIKWIMSIYVAFAIGLPLVGFVGWFMTVQKTSEISHDLDCRLKIAMIAKTEAETRTLSQARRSSMRRKT